MSASAAESRESFPPPARRRRTAFPAVGKLVSADLLIGELDRSSSVPLHTQVYTGLRNCILDGRLRPGASMPSTRGLPSLLGVSRNTVLEAYNQLRAEGFIEPRLGSGTYVAHSIPDLHFRSRGPVAPPRPQSRLPATQPPRLSVRGRRMISAPAFEKAFWRRPEAFYPGLPAFELLPLDAWRKLSDKRLTEPRRTYLGYGSPGGYGPLRMVIAEYLSASRGVRCRPEQVIVVSGAQQGIDLATRVLLDEGEDVWMEDPGYGGARSVFRASGANVVPVPVDKDGLVVSEGLARAPQARMAYVTPSHQYPLGHTMSLSRRHDLLNWAAANDSWIIEDDYDSEFRYSGRPHPALQGMSDGGDRVIYVGTFSKVLFPSLRLGYLVVPDELVDAFLMARSLTDRHQATLDQAVLADFILGGHFTRHIRRSRVAYAERQECMLDRLNQETAGIIQAEADPAGMSLVGWLPPGVSDLHVAERLAAAGIYAPPLSYFATEPQPRGALLLGYTGFTPPRIKFSSRKLGSTVREIVEARRPSGSGPGAAAPGRASSPGRWRSDRATNVTSISHLRRES
ncbi:PLP-dependent aminotransferase family protein [Streptomyces sp. NBC_00144]|uniref:MocR-like pyridoxine biosynthesis transcription factor PdxR n=1 Tax=Streptomyces sp. NBC_00144 TaxID=2975665 RepID=UPI003253F8F3